MTQSFGNLRTVSKSRVFSIHNQEDPNHFPLKQKIQSLKLLKNNINNNNPELNIDHDQKLPIDAKVQMPTAINSQSKTNNIDSNIPKQFTVKKFLNNKSLRKQYGRNLEYPINPINRPQLKELQPMTTQSKFKKSSSLQYQRNRSLKTSKMIEMRQLRKGKFDKAFKFLLENNKKYLDEHLNMKDQKAKPNQEIFAMTRSQILTTYREHFNQKDKHLDEKYYPEPQNKKQAFGLPEVKVVGNSTSHEFHNGKQQKSAQLATWTQGFKLQGPLWSPTTYSNAFPNHGKFDKMMTIAVWDKPQTGLRFVGNSMYKDEFKQPRSKAASLATWNNLHPYGNDFNRATISCYDDNHNQKDRHPIQSHKPLEYPLLKSDGFFNSEYKNEFKNKNIQPINASNK